MNTPTKKPKIKREKSTSTKGHYVKNSDLLPAVIEAKELGVVTDKLIRMIQLIAERYSRKSWFIGYSYREDMVSAAVENLCKNALKFDHLRYSNPFAFYTTAITRSFLQYMADEKKHRNIRDRLLIEAGANPSFGFANGDEGDSYEPVDSDTIPDIDRKILEDDELPVEKPLLDVDGEVIIPEPVEVKFRHKDRVPGAVTRYGPNDIELDPVTGAYRPKVKIEEPVKKKSPKAVSEKAAASNSVVKKTDVKKDKTAPKKNASRKSE